jgi:hypothetical protein
MNQVLVLIARVHIVAHQDVPRRGRLRHRRLPRGHCCRPTADAARRAEEAEGLCHVLGAPWPEQIPGPIPDHLVGEEAEHVQSGRVHAVDGAVVLDRIDPARDGWMHLVAVDSGQIRPLPSRGLAPVVKQVTVRAMAEDVVVVGTGPGRRLGDETESREPIEPRTADRLRHVRVPPAGLGFPPIVDEIPLGVHRVDVLPEPLLSRAMPVVGVPDDRLAPDCRPRIVAGQVLAVPVGRRSRTTSSESTGRH